VDHGAVRFVAKFDNSTGKFSGYGWDKDMSYTYDDFLKEALNDLEDQLKNANSPEYQHYNNAEDARKSFINLSLLVALPEPILKEQQIRLTHLELLLQRC
jgi:hypothetical protein